MTINETADDISRVAINPRLTLSDLPAPMFCPTKVARAAEKFMAGRMARLSILMAAAYQQPTILSDAY